MDNGKLLKKIKKGDISAFEEVIRLYYPAMLGFAASILRDSQSAEDVAQEVFIRFWENRHGSDKINSVRNYFYVSTRNLAINHIRSEKRLNQRHARLSYEEDNFLTSVVEEETFRILNEALESLPGRSRMVLMLTVQGFSLEEIARQMEVSVNTVKSTKAYAINKLKERFGNHSDLLMILALFI